MNDNYIGDVSTQRDIPEKDKCSKCGKPESANNPLFYKDFYKSEDLLCNKCLIWGEDE